MSFYVYILASRRNGTLYIGMTDDLARRVWEHRIGAVRGFTRRHGVKMLVWFEVHESRESAFQRERQLKKWNRVWKLELIERENSRWRDLFEDREKNWVPASAGTSGCVFRSRIKLRSFPRKRESSSYQTESQAWNPSSQVRANNPASR
jgi:putative endonuclease